MRVEAMHLFPCSFSVLSLLSRDACALFYVTLFRDARARGGVMFPFATLCLEGVMPARKAMNLSFFNLSQV